MDRKFFSANTVEQAVLAAARHHGLDPDRVAYTLRDKKHGFTNIRRRVVIEVDPEAPERSAAAVAPIEERPEPSTPAPVRRSLPPADSGPRREDAPVQGSWRGSTASWTADEAPDREQAAISSALEEIISLLGMEIEISILRDEEEWEVELSGEDSDALLAHEGALLDAIEHLLPRMVRGLAGHAVPCRLDSGGFRAAHRQRLRELAERAADEVRRDRHSQSLDPMSPADRRWVHMALAEDPEVRTESEGSGFLKRVRVSPVQPG